MKYVIGFSEGNRGHHVVITEQEFYLTYDPKVTWSKEWTVDNRKRYDSREEAQAWIDDQKAKAELCREMGYGLGRYQGD